MPPAPLRYAPYAEAAEVPNVVVDGAPNDATTLALSHWPGIPQPPGLARDLSAEMAYAHLDHPAPTGAAEVATNDHVDQDGLVAVHALVDPATALAHRDLLVDVAAAGDFATYRYRSAARASMALWTLFHPERSPWVDDLAGLARGDRVAEVYRRCLPLLVPVATEPERFRAWWAEDDASLDASEAALAAGTVTIAEHPDVDLAVITVDDAAVRGGHRFGGGGQSVPEVHPLAVNTASSCLRQLIVRGQRYRYLDRYETWVQLHSRPAPRRRDLRPLAEALTAAEPGGVTWQAEPPSALTPSLAPEGGSDLAPAVVVDHVLRHLRTAPAAWDPTPTTTAPWSAAAA